MGYSGINKLTVPDKYPMPTIDELIDRVGECKGRYFTCLDLMKKVKVAEESMPRTLHGTVTVLENTFWSEQRSGNLPASDELVRSGIL